MNMDLSQALATISRMGKLIPDIFKIETDHERGTQLTAALRTLWPGCGLSACLLNWDGNSFGSAHDANGVARDDWRGSLLDILHSEAKEPPTKLPEAIVLPDHILAMEWVAGQDRRIGLCALGIHSGMPEEIRAVAQIFLIECALLLGLHLQAEARERTRQRLADDAADLAWMANLGELAGPLIHQFNNFLNVSMLNVLLLERQLDPSFRPDLESIRRQGAETATMVRHLQHNREKERPSPHAVDLNAVVGELLANGRTATAGHLRVNSGQVRVQFEPAELPAVFGSVPDLKRLLQFLLSQSAAANGGDVDVRIQTGATSGHVWIRVEDSAPAVATDLLPHLFESQIPCRRGADQLKLAACKSLVRRLRGEIRAENRDGAGLAVTVELPTNNGTTA